MLEKLTLNNMDDFKRIYNKSFNRISYSKDFFHSYYEQNFLLKYIYRKFVKLIKINNQYIGYIWYEILSEKYIKIWALYIDNTYISLINKNTLSYFNYDITNIEEFDTEDNSLILDKLGFKKCKFTILLKINLSNYINLNKYILKNKEYNINLKKLIVGKDEYLRCTIQNDIFIKDSRRPLTVEDIYADMNQDYFIKELCYFGLINGEYLGYGQIIYNRNMYTIVNFGLVSKYRGKGLSKFFLNMIIEKAKEYGIQDLYIRVDPNNIKAINLYKNIGFIETKKIVEWQRCISKI